MVTMSPCLVALVAALVVRPVRAPSKACADRYNSAHNSCAELLRAGYSCASDFCHDKNKCSYAGYCDKQCKMCDQKPPPPPPPSPNFVIAGCSMTAVHKACGTTKPAATDRPSVASMCADACVRASIACADAPEFGMAVGPREVDNVKVLAGLCSAQPGKAGDGVCNILDIKKYSDTMQHTGGRPNCKEKMVLEMFDCIDNPLLLDQRDSIIVMRRMCKSGSISPSAGDGDCNPEDIAKYEKIDQPARGGIPECNSNSMLEMFDCVDSPLFKAHKASIVAMQQMCAKAGLHPPGHGGSNCLHQMNSISGYMGRGGVCCPADDPCNEKSGKDADPPEMCSVDCAEVWNPFWKKCGQDLVNLMDSSEGAKAQQAKMGREIEAFAALCQAAGSKDGDH